MADENPVSGPQPCEKSVLIRSSAKNFVFYLRNHSALFSTASRYRIFIEGLHPICFKEPTRGPLPSASGRAHAFTAPPSRQSRRYCKKGARPAILRHPLVYF